MNQKYSQLLSEICQDLLRDALEERRVYPVGTVRHWRGGDFEKQSNGKWWPVVTGKDGKKKAVPKNPSKPLRMEPRKEKDDPDAPEGGATGSSKDKGAELTHAPPCDSPICKERVTAPSSGAPYKPNPRQDGDGDGVGDSARVGVCGNCVPPPPGIPRLPNLTPTEREVETRFAEAFEKNPDGIVNEFMKQLAEGRLGVDGPNVFETDSGKLLSPDWNPQGVPQEDNFAARSRFNVACHQTANAVVKRAFLKKLDELANLSPEDPKKRVLVTSGGCASGKGYCIENVEETNSISKQVGAVWDAAGEQNATENPWIMKECEKRGIKPVFTFVDADPSVTWASPDRGVVERANKKGRMVDARLFADSYAIGAKNFKAFYDREKDKGRAEFIFISGRSKPKVVPDFPEEAVSLDAEQVYAQASEAIDKHQNLKPAVRRGASIGRRIWGPPA